MPEAAQDEPIDDAAEAAVRVGRTLLDKWHLDAVIDVGGMAAVYAATHRNGMRGAVKILHRRRSTEPTIAARFRREGYIANKVAHPNVVRVLDDDVDDDGSVFLVMELLEGTTLGDCAAMHGGRLTADAVLLAADQILDVLAVAHDAEIVHRDVKPDNVFVTDDGQIKVLDFGIARLFEAGRSETMAGLPMGSPAFMSPEQARGRWDLVGAQSDVWSVGATMFTLLSGRDVHIGETVPELLAAIFTNPAPSLATVAQDLHPLVVEAVDRALALRLAERWPDARAMQSAVRKAYAAVVGKELPVTSTGSRPIVQGVRERAASRATETTRPPATTVVAAAVTEAPAHRRARRLALASGILLAVGLGVAGAARASHVQEHEAATASRSDTIVSVAPVSTGATPETHAATVSLGTPTTMTVAPAPDLATAVPVSHPASAAPASAASHVHRRSIYDSRY